MATKRKRKPTRNWRKMLEIQHRAQIECMEVGRFIVNRIAEIAPTNQSPREEARRLGPPLRAAYYAQEDDVGFGVTVYCEQPYWHYVEYGTKEHGRAQKHVRPAIDEAKAHFT